jgi:hypothetical protein
VMRSAGLIRQSDFFLNHHLWTLSLVTAPEVTYPSVRVG